MEEMTAREFIGALSQHIEEKEEVKLQRFYKGGDPHTQALGVRFGAVFDWAKHYTDMPLDEVEKLLEDDHYEVRMGAVSIMDFQARRKKTASKRRRELYELYLRRHDRIDNWDFVDRAAANVVGGYLWDKPRDPLYDLAASVNPWERRTAMVSTHYFLKNGEVNDALKIAAILIHDEHELVNKAVGTFLREVGKIDEKGLKGFLDRFAATMPRVTLRYAVEKFDEEAKAHYLEIGRSN
jgi:3-methyladenine DNA glycosylase AlkD